MCITCIQLYLSCSICSSPTALASLALACLIMQFIRIMVFGGMCVPQAVFRKCDALAQEVSVV